MKGIIVLALNRWRRDIAGLKHHNSFHVPQRLIKACQIRDGQNRLVNLRTQKTKGVKARLHVTSGCELHIPKEFQSLIKGSKYVEFEIVDWHPPKSGSNSISLPDIDSDFFEGGSILRTHLKKERNRRLVQVAKEKRLRTTGDLRCDACGFSFRKRYGDLGEGFIEAHHQVPLSHLTKSTKTKVEDLALVCSNCHRMIHRSDPLLTLKKLRVVLG